MGTDIEVCAIPYTYEVGAPDGDCSQMVGAHQPVVDVVSGLGHEQTSVLLPAHDLVRAAQVRGSSDLVESTPFGLLDGSGRGASSSFT
jgi:hypothetical protein